MDGHGHSLDTGLIQELCRHPIGHGLDELMALLGDQVMGDPGQPPVIDCVGEIVGREDVEGWGGRVARLRVVPGVRTTRLVERIRRL